MSNIGEFFKGAAAVLGDAVTAPGRAVGSLYVAASDYSRVKGAAVALGTTVGGSLLLDFAADVVVQSHHVAELVHGNLTAANGFRAAAALMATGTAINFLVQKGTGKPAFPLQAARDRGRQQGGFAADSRHGLRLTQ